MHLQYIKSVYVNQKIWDNNLVPEFFGVNIMSDVEIVKVCKKHGDLTADMVFVYKRSDRPCGVTIRCRLCKLDKDRKWNEQNKEKRVESSTAWREKNKEKVNEYMREYRQEKKTPQQKWKENNRDQIHDSEIKRLYGLSGEDYASILKMQNGLCAICNQPETRASRTPGETCRLALDHNHTTGQVRGLLCHSCNTGIGKFKESKDLLIRAISYLEFYEEC